MSGSERGGWKRTRKGNALAAYSTQWIAELLQHGLLTGSFVPEQTQRELRELTRYRTAIVRERADEVNRLQKVLEGATIKLASGATDIMGVSGRAMLEGLIAGTTESAVLADLARGRMPKQGR